MEGTTMEYTQHTMLTEELERINAAVPVDGRLSATDAMAAREMALSTGRPASAVGRLVATAYRWRVPTTRITWSADGSRFSIEVVDGKCSGGLRRARVFTTWRKP